VNSVIFAGALKLTALSACTQPPSAAFSLGAACFLSEPTGRLQYPVARGRAYFARVSSPSS